MIKWILDRFERRDYPPKKPYPMWKKYYRRVDINNAIRDLAKEIKEIKKIIKKGEDNE